MKSISQTPQLKSSPIFSEIIDSEHIFTPNEYKFTSDNTKMEILYSQENQYPETKTYLNIRQKLREEQLHLITMKIIHKNLVGLRKIGKSKKPG